MVLLAKALRTSGGAAYVQEAVGVQAFLSEIHALCGCIFQGDERLCALKPL